MKKLLKESEAVSSLKDGLLSGKFTLLELCRRPEIKELALPEYVVEDCLPKIKQRYYSICADPYTSES